MPKVAPQKVEFRWKLIKVGAMDFEIGPAFFTKAAANADEFGQPLFARFADSFAQGEGAVAPVHLAVTGVTNGPLKWFKNYQARAELTIKGKSKTFVLAGEDGGVYEKRALVFAPGLPPMIESFIDSTALQPLEVQDDWKRDTVDPLTVFEWMIFSAVEGQSCEKHFWIYDGKRRYAARTTDLTSETLDGAGGKQRSPANRGLEQNKAGSCRLTLVGSDSNKKERKLTADDVLPKRGQDTGGALVQESLEEVETALRYDTVTKPKAGWGSLWPFGKGDRHIDFVFKICSSKRVIVARVEMGAPIGRVIGTSKDQC